MNTIFTTITIPTTNSSNNNNDINDDNKVSLSKSGLCRPARPHSKVKRKRKEIDM